MPAAYTQPVQTPVVPQQPVNPYAASPVNQTQQPAQAQYAPQQPAQPQYAQQPVNQYAAPAPRQAEYYQQPGYQSQQYGAYPPPQPGAGWPQNPYAPQGYAPAVPMICSIADIYKRVFSVLLKKPLRLWGVSLMFNLLTFVAFLMTLIPIIYLPIIATLQFGITCVFLSGYRGQDVGSAMLFRGFNDFKRIAGGMLWSALWVFIFALIPVAGIVFAVIKGYSYRFVPYILMTQPEVGATDALKKSVEMTDGYKGKMFGADILIYAVIFIPMLLLWLLASIPYVGIFFGIVDVLVAVAVGALAPLCLGLVGAAFYDEIEKVKK